MLAKRKSDGKLIEVRLYASAAKDCIAPLTSLSWTLLIIAGRSAGLFMAQRNPSSESRVSIRSLRNGSFRPENISGSWNAWPAITLSGDAIIFPISFPPEESYGTSATILPSILTVSWPQRTCLIRYGSSAICGTGCARAEVSPRAGSCRGTKLLTKSGSIRPRSR